MEILPGITGLAKGRRNVQCSNMVQYRDHCTFTKISIMPITWTSALETGHPTIDAQHKDLIATVDKLLEACQQGQAVDKVGPTIDYLVSYTKRHFTEEESLMLKSNYPDSAEHRNLHVAFLQVVADMHAELQKAGPTPTLVSKIVRTVSDWLISHIKQHDTKLAAHLKIANT